MNQDNQTNNGAVVRGKNDIDCIAQFFWDVDVGRLDTDKHKKFIIERLFRYGRPEQIKWVLARYSDAEIIEAVKSSRTLDKKSATYWALHYNIPPDEVLCLNRQLMQECFY